MRKNIDIRRLCAWIIGIVFIFSGCAKLMDPVGTSYIVTEYFKFFHLSFLSPIAKVMGSLIALTETMLGIALMCGIFRKITAWASSGVLVFFTLITTILMIANPEMDCGCFGESVHLSHFQSLLKNLLLLLLAAGAWLGVKEWGEPQKRKYVSAGLSLLSVCTFAIFSYISIPLKDYTDFSPGQRIVASDPYSLVSKKQWQTLFIYEKEDSVGTLIRDTTEQPFGKKDWDFVGIENRFIIDKYPMPPLPIKAEDGTEMDYLAADGPVMLISLYKKPSERKWKNICQWAESAESAGYICLIVSDQAYYNDYPCYLSDKKTLSTLNRSNGGVTYLQDGEIIGKWSYAGRPDEEELEEIAQKDSIETITEMESSDNRSYQAFMLYLFAVLLLL